MTTHVNAAPTATPTAAFPATPGWLTLSAAFGDQVPVIADRSDLTVTVIPGAGQGSPACYLPDLAAIEVDGSHLPAGVDPATVSPHRIGDRKRYRLLWGLLTHECAHAKHSVWRDPAGAPPAALAAANALEESRIEKAHLRRRPRDRYWLRAAITKLILDDFSPANPKNAPTMTRHDAGRAAALVLARVDGGVLNARETSPVTRVVRAIIGEDTLQKLRSLWREAHRTADHDACTMLDIGRRWCEALGLDPEAATPPRPDPQSAVAPSSLADAITQISVVIDLAIDKAPAPSDPTTHAMAAKAADDRARKVAEETAKYVFAPPPGGAGGPATLTRKTRPPRPDELRAARQLGQSLDTAGTRNRTAVRTTSAIPPGRLRMRGVLAAEAQLAAGAEVTAEPFISIRRTTAPAPPLRLGIACDVTGSMARFAPPVASAAWILANAPKHTQVPA